jgi:hypothetical protein
MSLDERLEAKIDRLEAEQASLRRLSGSRLAGLAEQDREAEIKVELDRLWDWKRQRRALRDAGRDPDEAHERDAAVVERYLQ